MSGPMFQIFSLEDPTVRTVIRTNTAPDPVVEAELVRLLADRSALILALQRIARGAINRRPGHVEFEANLTKEQIFDIATETVERVLRGEQS